jgi:predicted AAA+ superfamily ATPase
MPRSHTQSPSPSELTRRIEPLITADLRHKMVFVAGPRQVGKTTVAQHQLADTQGAYFNWDVASHRRALRDGDLPSDKRLWVFDELHKQRGWQRWLKGVYDVEHSRHAILVTGSARLDVFTRGGDSLQGRYLLHRMHPVTLSELSGLRAVERIEDLPKLALAAPSDAVSKIDALATLGGFPEPLLRGSQTYAARFRLGYGTRVVRQDIRDLETFRDLDKIEQLFDRLPALVGSPLSVNALREDLEVAPATVESWIKALERLYAVYRVPPYGPPKIKAVKKAQKLYFWDWSRIEASAQRAENMIMSHLLRLTHWLEDVHGEKAELRYFRDVLGHEVDAIVLRKGKPWLAVEIKESDAPLDAGLRYFAERVSVPHVFQVSLRGRVDRMLRDVGKSGVRLVPASRFLASLP